MQDDHNTPKEHPEGAASTNPPDSASKAHRPPYLRVKNPKFVEYALNSWPHLSTVARVVYLIMAADADEFAETRLSQKDIAYYAEASVTAVKEAIKDLVLTGRISKRRNHNGRTRENNLYVLNGVLDGVDAPAKQDGKQSVADVVQELEQREAARRMEVAVAYTRVLEARNAELESLITRLTGQLPESSTYEQETTIGTPESQDRIGDEPTSETYSRIPTIGMDDSGNVVHEGDNVDISLHLVDALFDRWYDRGLSRLSGGAWDYRTSARRHYRRQSKNDHGQYGLDELWEQVRDLQADERARSESTGPPDGDVGLAKCPDCGSVYSFDNGHRCAEGGE